MCVRIDVIPCISQFHLFKLAKCQIVVFIYLFIAFVFICESRPFISIVYFIKSILVYFLLYSCCLSIFFHFSIIFNIDNFLKILLAYFDKLLSKTIERIGRFMLLLSNLNWLFSLLLFRRLIEIVVVFDNIFRIQRNSSKTFIWLKVKTNIC